jgi:arsenite/tail-anchored protein-transporting ATPase
LRLLIYTGKGGTGKTVIACSTGIKISDNGYLTLLISSDPAHTLSDALMANEIESGRPTEILPNLHAIQIDPINEIDEQFNVLLTYLASSLMSKGLDKTPSYEMAMMPGMTQVLTLLKIEEYLKTRKFDTIVLDMPASGEALRYLYFPKLIGSLARRFTSVFGGVFTGLLKMLQPSFGAPSSIPSNVINNEMELVHRLEALSDIISDPTITSIRLVANPDTFSIENAKRTLMSANLYGINADMVIINKIIPRSLSKDKFFVNWAYLQNVRLAEAKSSFYPLAVREIPLYEQELKGIPMLRDNAQVLFGDQDPRDILYKGKIFDFTTNNSGLTIKLKVPFSEKEDFLVEHSSDSLIVKVKTQVGYMVNVIPLPVATMGMKLNRADLNNGELVVSFEKP